MNLLPASWCFINKIDSVAPKNKVSILCGLTSPNPFPHCLASLCIVLCHGSFGCFFHAFIILFSSLSPARVWLCFGSGFVWKTTRRWQPRMHSNSWADICLCTYKSASLTGATLFFFKWKGAVGSIEFVLLNKLHPSSRLKWPGLWLCNKSQTWHGIKVTQKINN